MVALAAGAFVGDATADTEGAGDTEGAAVFWAITLAMAKAAIRSIESRLVNFILWQ